MKYLQPGAYAPPPPDIEPLDFGDPAEGAGVVAWLAAALLALSFAAGFIFRGWL